MAPGQHLPADHSRGDANTIGGYAAAHDRPATFEGPDGLSYSVEILASLTGSAGSTWGAYLLFVQWSRVGASAPSGHLESAYLGEADTEADARAVVGALSLGQVRTVLHALVEEGRGGASSRRWWDAMRDGDDSPRGDE